MEPINEIIEALQIFARYKHVHIMAEHDEIFVQFNGTLTKNEVDRLEALNWRQSDPENCPNNWSTFT
jgi:hypothetical protein